MEINLVIAIIGLIGIIVTAVIGPVLLKKMEIQSKKTEEEIKTIESIKISQLVLLWSKIVSDCEKYIEKGYLPFYARVYIKDLYENYEILGGNHGVKSLVEQTFKLPPKLNKE